MRLVGLAKSVRRRPRRARHRPRHPRRRVLLAARAVGLRQDHDAADDRRLRAAHRRARSCWTATTSSSVPAHRRPVNTVFQSYALFPFLDVLGQRRVRPALPARSTRRDDPAPGRRDARAGPDVRATPRRRPGQLSGGQQQRVALARALVLQPRVLLLDEPLGALDAKLRKHLQLELKAIQQSVGVTFVYVTHDQEEALTMSDRLAVMRDGRVEQVGAPEAVYAAPRHGVRRRLPRLGQRARRRGARRSRPAAVACRLGALAAARGRDRRTRARQGRSCARSASRLTATDRPAGRADGAQRVPRAGRPGRLPRPDHPRRRPAGGRADPAGRGAQRRRADVVAVRRRAARCTPPSRRRRPGCSPATTSTRPDDDADRGAAARPVAGVSGGGTDLTARASARPAAAASRRPARGPRRPSRSRTPGPGRRPGPRSATWIDSPSSSAEKVIANASASTIADLARGLAVAHDLRDRVAPPLVQLDPVLAISGCRNAWAHRSNHSPQAPGISPSPCGTQVVRTSSSSRSRAVRSALELGRRRARRTPPRRTAAPRSAAGPWC